MRKVAAANAFHEAEATSILRLAIQARHRTLRNPEPGQLVYYFRRGKNKNGIGIVGPLESLQ